MYCRLDRYILKPESSAADDFNAVCGINVIEMTPLMLMMVM
jgi:hypothetical protein